MVLSNPEMGLRRQPSVKFLICGKPEESTQVIITYANMTKVKYTQPIF